MPLKDISNPHAHYASMVRASHYHGLQRAPPNDSISPPSFFSIRSAAQATRRVNTGMPLKDTSNPHARYASLTEKPTQQGDH